MAYSALPEGFEPYDFHEFHRRVLPERLAAGNGALAADDALRIGPIAFQVGDASYSYVPHRGGIDVVEGDRTSWWAKDADGRALCCRVTRAGAVPELAALPGSHTASHPFIDARDPRAPKGVSLATRSGDVSFHYGDLMHAAPPPTRREGPHRISVLTAWVGEGARHHRGERAYNDVLLDRDDGQVEHLADRIRRD